MTAYALLGFALLIILIIFQQIQLARDYHRMTTALRAVTKLLKDQSDLIREVGLRR